MSEIPQQTPSSEILSPSTTQRSLRQALTDEHSYGTTLLVLLIDQYGTEALGWAPQTIRKELEEDFGVEIPPGNFDKLLAAITVISSNDFFVRLPAFIQLCVVLSGNEFNPGIVPIADAAECLWALTEAFLISPPESDEPLSPDIRYYLGKVLDDEGIVDPPDLLRLALRDMPSGRADFSQFSTDEAGFSAEYQMQAQRGQEIADEVHENLADLLQQVVSLPLKNGDTQRLTERLQTQLQNSQKTQ